MAVRLEGIMSLTDNFTSPIKDAVKNLRSLASTAESVKPKFEKVDGGLEKASKSSERLRDSMGRFLPMSEKNAEGQKKHNDQIEKGSDAASKLERTLKGVLSVTALIATGKAFVKLSDDITQATSRLAMINDGQQKVTELNNMIFNSAQRTGGAYLETLDSISKMGLQTGDLFKSNKELVDFMEVLNKQFVIGGTELEAQKSAMLQLTQAMGSGVLRGDEFNSIFEATPGIIELIANELGVSVKEMRGLAAEGKISADVVKSALLNSIDETNAKFEQMPKTFGRIWQEFKNSATKALTPVSLKFNQLINSQGFQKMFVAASRGVEIFANALIVTLNIAESVSNAIANNWAALEPIFYALGGAVAGLIGMFAVMGLQAIKTGVMTFVSFAMAHLPLIIIAATLGLVILTLKKLGITAGEVFGFIIGVVFALFTIIVNIVKVIANTFIVFAELIVNNIIDFQNTFSKVCAAVQNAWNSMLTGLHSGFASFINGALKMVGKFVNTFIRGINAIIRGLNKLSFTLPDWMGGKSFGIHKEEISEWNAPQMAMPKAPTLVTPTIKEEVSFKKFELGGVKDAFGRGQDFAADKTKGFSDLLKNSKDSIMGGLDARGLGKMPKLPEGLDPLDAGAGGKGKAGKALKDTAKHTKDLEKGLNRSTDDLKTIKDLMTQRAVTNISWDKIEVKVDNKFGDVHKEADLDGFIDSLGQGLNEAVNSIMTGVTLLE